jgi:hypothetical protein
MSLTVALLPLVLLLADANWTVQDDSDGIRVETRKETSGFEEVRVIARSNRSPERACSVVWEGAYRTPEQGMKKREALTERPNERWTYERVSAPFADRDYTLHMKREALKAGCRIGFETQNDRGPPPQEGVVRIPIIRGTWVIDQADHEGTRIIYTVYAEPGGNVSAMFARSQQRERAVNWVKRVLNRIEAQP